MFNPVVNIVLIGLKFGACTDTWWIALFVHVLWALLYEILILLRTCGQYVTNPLIFFFPKSHRNHTVIVVVNHGLAWVNLGGHIF